MANIIVGVIAGLFIGVGCRFFNVPLPGPPSLVGAMLAVAMATGYTVTDKYVAKEQASTKHLCGGPTGVPANPDCPPGVAQAQTKPASKEE
ncbi:MAG: DUF1427 family protein [Leptolyngbya sp. BL-A-14]